MRETDPAVWRRLEVAADASLHELHRVIQTAMGWQDRHLYEFRCGDALYGLPDDDAPEAQRDSRRTLLSEVGEANSSLVYIYDFGDGWQHDILVEDAAAPDPLMLYPVCTGGARACPPEDCGGLPGYEELLEALRDPSHERHEELRRRVGGLFDPDTFDPNAVNSRLRRRRLGR